MTAKVKSDLNRIKAQLVSVRATSSPGTITSRTTRGTVRKSSSSKSTGATTSTSVPEWG